MDGKENGTLSRENALILFRMMARTRALLEVLILHRQDVFGAFLSGLGQEGIAAGASLAFLEKGILLESQKSGDHRTTWGLATALDERTGEKGHNHALEIIRNHLLKSTSPNRARDGNIHWGCLECRLLPFMTSDMGRAFPVLLGMTEEMARNAAWRTTPAPHRPVGISFFGEGADQQGCISEANSWIAASNYVRTEAELQKFGKFLDDLSRETGVLRGAPVIEVVVANERSIYTDPGDEHGYSDLAKRALGYGNMVGVDVDGDDAEAVYVVTKEAIERAQRFQATRIIAHTYRRTGHNEDQIQRNTVKLQEAFRAFKAGEWDFEPAWDEGKILDVDPEEFKARWQTEPLRRFREKLTSSEVATEKELTAIMCDARKEMWEFFRRAQNEPDVTPAENRKDYLVTPPYPSWSLPSEAPGLVPRDASRNPRHITYQDAYIETVRELLRSDERVTFFGQDVRTGGVLVPTRKLAEEFGSLRVFNAPITEEAMHSNAAGRALAGGRPIFEGQQFAPFFADAFPSIVSVVAPNWYQKKMKFPCVNIFHSGVVRSGGSGHYHETWVEAYLYHMLGITIVAPADAYDLVGLLRAAHEYDGPVAMLLQIAAATDSQFSGDIPAEPYLIPLGKAKVKREGSDFTVISYGAACVRAALNEAEHLAKEGINVEVVDLRTIWPCDWETMRRSIEKTGRFAIMHEDWKTGGVGESIKGRLLEGEATVLPFVRTPTIEIVASDDVPIPTARALVWDRLPYAIEEVDDHDGKGRPIKKRFHRSSKLAHVIRDAMRY